MYYLLLAFILTGCAHPRADQWWPADHYKMMSECRIMCKNNVKAYSTSDGECICHKKELGL